MKREALIRELTKLARKQGSELIVKKGAGKGSHYRVYLGGRATTIQSGELSDFHVKRIKKQLGIS